jgi:hypothetical protein
MPPVHGSDGSARSLAEEFDILWRVGCLGRPCDHQASEYSTSINEWNQTGALQVFGDHFILYLRWNSGGVGHVNDYWVQCLQNALSGSAYRVDHVLLKKAVVLREVENVQPGHARCRIYQLKQKQHHSALRHECWRKPHATLREASGWR